MALVSLLLGRAWQHLFWDAPFRTLLWNEELLKFFVEKFTTLSWHQYVTSEKVDQGIQNLIKIFGSFYLFGAFISYFAVKKKIWALNYIFVTGLGLVFLGLLSWAEKFFYFGMLFEHSIQMATPFIFYLFFLKDPWITPRTDQKMLLILKVSIALTFIGHGLFAIGFYPVPGHFIDMLINVFGCSEKSAKTFLMIMGTIDIISSIGLFIRPIRIFSLWFMIGWGAITAMARITAHLDFQLLAFTGNQWVYEMMVRLPHALIPLFLLFKLREENTKAST